MSKVEKTREWLKTLNLNQFYPLKKEHLEVVNEVAKEYTKEDEYAFRVTAIGVTKTWNYENEENYYVWTTEEGVEQIIPFRHQLKKEVKYDMERRAIIR